MNISKYNQKAFTIIETLVAIAILMIAIAGPLVVANKGLIASLYAKDQSIAAFLAQEGMEMIRNAKDMCTYTSCQFLGSGASATFADFISYLKSIHCHDGGHVCSVYLDPVSRKIAFFNVQNDSNMLQQTLLYDNCDYGYTHYTGSLCSGFDINPTLFSRYFNIKEMGNSAAQVTVTVRWKEGTIANEISINSILVAEPL